MLNTEMYEAVQRRSQYKLLKIYLLLIHWNDEEGRDRGSLSWITVHCRWVLYRLKVLSTLYSVIRFNWALKISFFVNNEIQGHFNIELVQL